MPRPDMAAIRAQAEAGGNFGPLNLAANAHWMIPALLACVKELEAMLRPFALTGRCASLEGQADDRILLMSGSHYITVADLRRVAELGVEG